MSSNPRIPFELSSQRDRLTAPDGKPLIIQMVVNIENWLFDEAMPRKLLPPPHGMDAVPDVPNFSWMEYGLRCGLPRIMDALRQYGLNATCSINASVVETYPQVAEAVLNEGWEFVGHGLHQRALHNETSESEIIAAALHRLRRFSGQPVDGWLSPGLRQTLDTPDLLKANGIRYCCDWALDDLPAWMRTLHGPLLSIPYSLEINDSVAHAVQHQVSDELLLRLESTLELFAEEASCQPRIISLGLHPHLIGVAHRFVQFRKMLEIITRRSDTIVMSSGQIADWFESVSAAPEFHEDVQPVHAGGSLHVTG
jgi:allantoinase